jgi:hypothetical protein
MQEKTAEEGSICLYLNTSPNWMTKYLAPILAFPPIISRFLPMVIIHLALKMDRTLAGLDTSENSQDLGLQLATMKVMKPFHKDKLLHLRLSSQFQSLT